MDLGLNLNVIDLNIAAEEEEFMQPMFEHQVTFEHQAAPEDMQTGIERDTAIMSVDDATDTAAPTGQTISSEDSGSEDEVHTATD